MRKIIFRVHALQRMFERGMREHEVLHIIETGEMIETYPDDHPYPSQLLFGWYEDRPLHVVVADHADDQEMIVITVYEPDADQWEADLKRRKI